MGTENWRRGNSYDLISSPYGIGYDLRGRRFFFSLEDFDKIKDLTWCVNPKHGYVINNRKGIRMHRLIMDAPNDYEVDHINHNRADNRRENLRIVTHQENNFNKSFNKNSQSKIKGVYWSERLGKWYAKIHYNRKSIHLGVFENQNDAIKARKNAEQKYFGEYAYKDYKNTEEFI